MSEVLCGIIILVLVGVGHTEYRHHQSKKVLKDGQSIIRISESSLGALAGIHCDSCDSDSNSMAGIQDKQDKRQSSGDNRPNAAFTVQVERDLSEKES